MATPIVTPAKRDALLAAHRLDPWSTIMTPEEAASLERWAHVNVEGTYHEAHFEMENFEDLRLEGDGLYALLPNRVRYRVEGLLSPGSPPDMISCGYNGALLRPFVIEALTHGRPAEQPGLRARAYRSLGVWERNGYGEYTAPRVSCVDVLTGHKDGVVYVAVIRALNRPDDFAYTHSACRSAWRGLFPGSGSPSSFWLREVVNPGSSPPPAELPSDPAESVLAVRERLVQRVQKHPNQLPIDGVIMAFAKGAVHCLRMGKHRVLRRTSAAIETVLWEHTLYRYPPAGMRLSDLPDYSAKFLLSTLQPGPISPVHSASTEVGDRWIILSGQLLAELVGHVSDEEVAGALCNESPDDIVAWLEATAARFPDKHGRDKNADWGLVVMDVVPDAPAPSSPPGGQTPNAINPEALLAQLHELEKNRT